MIRTPTFDAPLNCQRFDFWTFGNRAKASQS
jgi:hypothetical protein